MSAASPQKQIFVAWDFSAPDHANYFEALNGTQVGSGSNARTIHVPGLGVDGGDIESAVLAKIDRPEVDILAAVVDRANGNVAFEIGFALGRGKRVLLLRTKGPPPKWVDAGAPLSGQLIHEFDGPEQLQRRLDAAASSGDGLYEIPKPTAAVRDETLVLCPRDGRTFSFQMVFDGKPKCVGLRRSSDSPKWSLKELPAKVAAFGRVIWLYVRENQDPSKTPDSPPDGSENAQLALMAGYARGLGGREVQFWREGRKDDSTRVLRDVENGAKHFVDVKALKELVAEIKDTTPETRAANNFEQTLDDYRAAALRDYGSVRLLGFPQSMHAALSLDALHVEVFCRRRGSHGDEADRASPGARFERESGIDLARIFAAGTALGRKSPPRNAVLVGHPGLGKSTQLKRMLCHVLRAQDEKRAEELPTTFGLPSDVVPLFIPLHRLRTAKDRLDDLVSAELTRLGVVHEDTFVPRLFAERPILLLLDGLDEATAEGVAALAPAWAAKALAEPNDARGVVTVRYEAFPKTDEAAHPLVAKAMTEIVELRELDDRQVREFVGKWYEAVESADARRDPSTTASDVAKRRAADLARQLDTQSANLAFAGLAKTPLLLTALCLVHREGGGCLPRSRAAVLKACIDVLLVTWRRSQGVVAPYDAEDAAAILRAVGRFMQDRGVSSATAADLQEALAKELARSVWKARPAAAVLDEIRLHSGILVGDANAGYEFPHRGFREYFAAESYWRHIGKEPPHGDRPGLLARLVREAPQKKSQESWNETIQLFLALRDPCYAAEWFALALRSPLLLKPEFEKFVDACWRVADEPPIDAFLSFLRGASSEVGVDERLIEVAQRILRGNATGSVLKEAMAPAAQPKRSTSRGGAALATSGSTLVSPRGAVELVRIAAGEFLMGSSRTETDRHKDEEPQLRVRITRDFLLGRHPVTNGEYALFLNEAKRRTKPENWGARGFDDPRQPVIGVTWDDAVAFCAWAGGHGLDGLVGQLPTEAQWEFAARAGRRSRYWSGDEVSDLDDVGWYFGNSEGHLHRVGEKPDSPWNLNDIHGLVWEWCADWYDDYPNLAMDDPTGPKYGNVRVFRGGSWCDPAAWCRSAARGWRPPGVRAVNLGFRLALSAPRAQ